ncbi:spore germination protein KC [Anaerovirgula multivorans]|uniref:Spore germination protein KC n=1 Tax=Anaerovirgula multivorans TaxID=312168 RepID=A0A239IP14_9FIRM|nr:Ger(x)C family spore germination protein [Anaerovirgula multivorans]SNS95410.1 spore germination protein KC [Anaerovirgula multivorans]
MKKLLVILLMISLISLPGCWSGFEIDTLAIIIAMGIDKSEGGYFLTLQILNPSAIAAKEPSTAAPVVLYSEEGKDLKEIMRKIHEKSGRRIYSAHLQLVVFSEEIVEEGINDALDFFARFNEFRTDFYFIVAKGTTARNVLSILTPLHQIPGIKLHESLKNSEQLWAPTKSVRIVELVNAIVAEGKEPVLTGVEVTEEVANVKLPTKSLESLQKSEIENTTKYFGLGVFKEDKLIGWLNEEESKGYNYVIGNVNNTVGYINYGDKVKITGEVTNAKSVMKASLEEGKPAIDVVINMTLNVGAVEGEFDVSKEENIDIFNELAEKKIKLMCEKTVDKAQNEFNADIFGFGEVIRRKYPKLWKEIEDDWDNEFPDLPVNITVKAKTNQLGQITKPFFIKEKE